jgi:hypothetical protein
MFFRNVLVLAVAVDPGRILAVKSAVLDAA